MKEFKTAMGVMLAIIIAAFAAFITSDVIDTLAEDSLKEAHHCTFVIPSEFEPGSERGTFINKNYPMESSSVSYHIYSNGNDVVMTNREKMQKQEAFEKAVIDKSGDLTRDEYEKLLSDSYNSAYGEDVSFTVESFDEVTIDGYPGYKIVSYYQASGEEVVHQTVYMILSKYKTFTITYQRAEDDECEDLFEQSAQTIHVQ